MTWNRTFCFDLSHQYILRCDISEPAIPVAQTSAENGTKRLWFPFWFPSLGSQGCPAQKAQWNVTASAVPESTPSSWGLWSQANKAIREKSATLPQTNMEAPIGLCKRNQVFQRGPGSFHLSLGLLMGGTFRNGWWAHIRKIHPRAPDGRIS